MFSILWKGGFFIEQYEVIENVAKEFLPKDFMNKPLHSPMPNKLSLLPIEKGECTKKYQRLLCRIMYVMLCSHSDVCFSVSFFNQYQKSAGEDHYRRLLDVLRYLYLTRDFRLHIRGDNADALDGFVDVSFRSLLKSKSISGYCSRIFRDIVSWRTAKQTVVALSTTEAEAVALCVTVCELIYLKI